MKAYNKSWMSSTRLQLLTYTPACYIAAARNTWITVVGKMKSDVNLVPITLTATEHGNHIINYHLKRYNYMPGFQHNKYYYGITFKRIQSRNISVSPRDDKIKK